MRPTVTPPGGVPLLTVDAVTIFPDYLVTPWRLALLGKARADGLLDLRVHDLRDYTIDKHRTVDDSPAGGGPGMVMSPEPWARALDELLEAPPRRADGISHVPTVLVPSPGGRRLNQQWAAELATAGWLLFTCGRYEGIDQRLLDEYAQRTQARGGHLIELSVGDYVLGGGEVAALVVVEAVARLLPGVLGNAESVIDDSFGADGRSGLLEAPVYTKPASWRGRDVPAVLLSGDHGAVARWRVDRAMERTRRQRPDLLERTDQRGGT